MTHGTTTGYRNGCRDRCCTDAMSAYMREYRKTWRRIRGDGVRYTVSDAIDDICVVLGTTQIRG